METSFTCSLCNWDGHEGSRSLQLQSCFTKQRQQGQIHSIQGHWVNLWSSVFKAETGMGVNGSNCFILFENIASKKIQEPRTKIFKDATIYSGYVDMQLGTMLPCHSLWKDSQSWSEAWKIHTHICKDNFRQKQSNLFQRNFNCYKKKKNPQQSTFYAVLHLISGLVYCFVWIQKWDVRIKWKQVQISLQNTICRFALILLHHHLLPRKIRHLVFTENK